MKIKIVFFTFFFIFSCATLKDSYPLCVFPENAPFPGGVINKTINIKSSEISEVNMEGENIYLCPVSEDLWRLLAPISLSSKKNSVNIYHNERVLLNVPISNKQYRESKITINNLDLVSPPTEYLARIKKESNLVLATLNIISKRVHSALIMPLPVEGLKSSEFGVKRFINNGSKNRHTGLDIASPIGTQIMAPLSGKVILTGDFYYRGKTIFLDHGAGIISTYSHMSDVFVTNGEIIKKNQIIGKVGQTGRVTGPHLHWQIVLYGIPVDPELFLKPPS